MAMHSYPYIWNYLPLVLQILAALGLACGMVAASFLIGKHKNSRTKAGPYECGMEVIGDARGRDLVFERGPHRPSLGVYLGLPDFCS